MKVLNYIPWPTLNLYAALMITMPLSMHQLSAQPASDLAENSSAPGFAKGATTFAITGGATLKTEGSYIEHEKKFYSTQQILIQSEQIKPNFMGVPVKDLTFEAEIQNKPAIQFDFEYGYSSRLGLGLTIHHFAIDILRQEFRNYINFSATEGGLVRQEYITPYPERATLYQGTSALFQTLFHFLPGKHADLYLAIRMGLTGFTGNAHHGLIREPNRYDSRIKNGLGGTAGMAFGINVYVNDNIGLRGELNYYRHLLQANTFRYRGLSSSHLLLGFLFKTN